MVPRRPAWTAPARPAMKALIMNAISLVRKMSTPRFWALSSLSRIARRPKPSFERTITIRVAVAPAAIASMMKK